MSEKILVVRSLFKEFDGLKALRGVSFSIKKGSITALIGPNGAGKTTLINILSGFIRTDRGRVLLKGEDITNLPPYKIASKGIARTFQNTRLFLQISVIDNVLLAMRYKNGENLMDVIFRRKQVLNEDREKREKALYILETVGLADKWNELAENLSYGQRKLLELARALATDGEVFLLDEPLAGVFPEIRSKIIDIMKEMRGKGKTIIFIEHIIKVVADISDEIIVLAHGEKIAEGIPEEVLKDKRVIEAYLGESDAFGG